MDKYTATFTDGTTISRNSEREYGVAWRATWTRDDNGAQVETTGFARDERSAHIEKPAKRSERRGMSANERAQVRRENHEYLARIGYRIEFAPAVVEG